MNVLPKTIQSEEVYPYEQATISGEASSVGYLRMAVYKKGETLMSDENPLEMSRQQVKKSVISEVKSKETVQNNKYVEDYLDDLEKEFEPYNGLFDSKMKIEVLYAGMHFVIDHLKNLVKPEALEDVELTTRQMAFIKGTMEKALDIVEINGGYKLKGFNMSVVLGIATYLNSLCS